MKVQFSEGGVRVRLGREAFDTLCAGGVLRLALPLAGGSSAVLLRRGNAFEAVAASDGLHLAWDGAALDALASRLPAREGLEAAAVLDGRPLRFVLEVDVRSGRSPRPPAPAVR